MNRVKVLIEGYAKEIENGWIASSSTTLVQTDGKNLIVDPGCNREKLLEELTKVGLATSDIDFVLITHSHADHSVLCGIFENAKIINNSEIYTKDTQIEHKGKIEDTDLEIIPTPGHSSDGCSLVAKTKDGIYVITGDTFWWKEGEEQKMDLEKPDPYVENMSEIITSRKRVVEIADYIIPGHGKMFKNPNK